MATGETGGVGGRMGSTATEDESSSRLLETLVAVVTTQQISLAVFRLYSKYVFRFGGPIAGGLCSEIVDVKVYFY